MIIIFYNCIPNTESIFYSELTEKTLVNFQFVQLLGFTSE